MPQIVDPIRVSADHAAKIKEAMEYLDDTTYTNVQAKDRLRDRLKQYIREVTVGALRRKAQENLAEPEPPVLEDS